MKYINPKYAAGAGLFVLWAGMVYLGKADAAPLVAAISGTLAALGTHSAMSDSADEPPTDAKQ